jgi:hypothetical protein
MKDSREESIPLKPEVITDLVWGLSMFFSQDEQQKKYGEDVKAKWDALATKYKDDVKTSKYIDNVNAIMSGTVYSFAQLRQQTSEQIKFYDELKSRRMQDLDHLASLSKDLQSITLRAVGFSIGGATFIQFASNALGVQQVAFGILGAGIFYIGLELILRGYRHKMGPKIMSQIQQEKEKVLKNQFEPKSQKLLDDLLKKVQSISSAAYQSQPKIEPEILKAISVTSSQIISGSFITGSNMSQLASEVTDHLGCTYCGNQNVGNNTGRCIQCGRPLHINYNG